MGQKSVTMFEVAVDAVWFTVSLAVMTVLGVLVYSV